jgi:hypothetical protein
MEYDDEQKARFRAEYARRRRKSLVAGLVYVPVLLGLYLAPDYLPLKHPVGIAVVVLGLALFVGLIIYGRKISRCPACEDRLSAEWHPYYCSKCGAPLR